MRKRKKRLFWAVLLAVLLTGCAGSLDMEDWLTPPRPVRVQSEIQYALMAYTGGGATLKYPRLGQYRSAITMIDLDSDGHDEAMVFCRMKNESGGTHLIVLDTVEDQWQVTGDVTGPGVNVERVVITRFDESDQLNILVGWNMLSRDKIGTVYCYANGRIMQSSTEFAYTEMTVADLDGDENNELFTVQLNAFELKSTGRMMKRNSITRRMHEVASIQLDGNIASYAGLTAGQIWPQCDGIPAARGVCIDAVKNTEMMQTEIVYWDVLDERLHVVDFDELESGKPGSTVSLRIGTERCRDIDGDGTIEFPILRYCANMKTDPGTEIPGIAQTNARRTEYYTAWVHMIASGAAEVTFYTVQTPGYVLQLDPNYAVEWIQNLYFKYEESDKKLTFYESISGVSILSVQLMTEKAFKLSENMSEPWVRIQSADENVYAYQLSSVLSPDQRALWHSRLHLDALCNCIVPTE